MATGFASALSEGQPAQIDLGEDALPCLVVGFTGADVMLAPQGPIPPDTLGPDGLIAYLLIEAGGNLQALKAHIREGYTAGRARRHAARSLPPRPAPHLLPRAARPSRAPAPGRQHRRSEDDLLARRQRRRPARRQAVELHRGRSARGRDRPGAGQPRDPRARRDGARHRHRRVAALHADRGRGSPAAGPADLRVPPSPRRIARAIRSAQFLDWEEMHGWFGSGHDDRQWR